MKRHIKATIGALLLVGVGFAICWLIRPPGPGFSPHLLIAEVPNIPEASDTFNCKHASLFMYDYFTGKGYECLIIIGNLDLNNETIFDCNHTWVWVSKPGEDVSLAFDWGHPCFDNQHYEGIEISYEQLKEAIEAAGD